MPLYREVEIRVNGRCGEVEIRVNVCTVRRDEKKCPLKRGGRCREVNVCGGSTVIRQYDAFKSRKLPNGE